jgi:hypothetical protein
MSVSSSIARVKIGKCEDGSSKFGQSFRTADLIIVSEATVAEEAKYVRSTDEDSNKSGA